MPLESIVIPPGPFVLLLFVSLAGSHCLGAPFLGLRQIGLHRCRIAEVHVGLAPVDQVQVGHGIVVVGRGWQPPD